MYQPAESKESYLERGLVCLGTEWLFHSNWQDLLGIFLSYFSNINKKCSRDDVFKYVHNICCVLEHLLENIFSSLR